MGRTTPRTARATRRRHRTQEERRAETRGKLLDATVQYLIELGYHRTTTSLVCERAGVSRGALLHHFPTKESLVVDAIWHLFAQRVRELDLDFEKLKTPERRLEALLDHMWAAFFSTPLFWAALELWVAARTDETLRQNLEPAERKLAKTIWSGWTALAGKDVARDREMARRFQDALALSWHMMRGMAMQKILKEDDSERRRLYEVWKSFVLQSVKPR